MSFVLSPFAYKKRTIQRCSSVIHSSNTVAILNTETRRMRIWYLDSREAGPCCYVVIYIYIYRKSITSITAVLLPFVTYSLTLPRIYGFIRSPFHQTLRTRRLALMLWIREILTFDILNGIFCPDVLSRFVAPAVYCGASWRCVDCPLLCS
jgi:hypothetical protein